MWLAKDWTKFHAMKKCPYCGTEYPDDATACAIDQTPFTETSSNPVTTVKFPKFGIFSERKIPVSLTLVSYLFFATGAGSFAAVGFLTFFLVLMASDYASSHILASCLIGGVLAVLVVLCLLIFPITMVAGYVLIALYLLGLGVLTTNLMEILSRLLGGAMAILFVYISRGLRMGSRGWRTCALVFIWLEFMALTFGIVHRFIAQGHMQQKWATTDWLESALGIILLIWQYRVLTRPDIRDLFYNESQVQPETN